MAKVNKSHTTYTIVVSSEPQRGMTVWALRDFVRALDAEGIPDNANLVAEHSHDTQHFTGLRVHHTVTVSDSDIIHPQENDHAG